MNEQRPNPATDRDPLIDIDEARERPRSLEQLTDQPDTGKLTSPPDETTADHDDDSIIPGDSSAIYERGTTIIPPG
jgi:hypothetical protein